MTSNVVTYSNFEYKKKDVIVDEDMNAEEEYQEKLNNLSKKIKKPKTLLEIRTKKGMWGYKTQQEEFKGELTREEMLDLRSKDKGDKWCW